MPSWPITASEPVALACGTAPTPAARAGAPARSPPSGATRRSLGWPLEPIVRCADAGDRRATPRSSPPRPPVGPQRRDRVAVRGQQPQRAVAGRDDGAAAVVDRARLVGRDAAAAGRRRRPGRSRAPCASRRRAPAPAPARAAGGDVAVAGDGGRAAPDGPAVLAAGRAHQHRQPRRTRPAIARCTRARRRRRAVQMLQARAGRPAGGGAGGEVERAGRAVRRVPVAACRRTRPAPARGSRSTRRSPSRPPSRQSVAVRCPRLPGRLAAGHRRRPATRRRPRATTSTTTPATSGVARRWRPALHLPWMVEARVRPKGRRTRASSGTLAPARLRDSASTEAASSSTRPWTMNFGPDCVKSIGPTVPIRPRPLSIVATTRPPITG